MSVSGQIAGQHTFTISLLLTIGSNLSWVVLNPYADLFYIEKQCFIQLLFVIDTKMVAVELVSSLSLNSSSTVQFFLRLPTICSVLVISLIWNDE